MPEAKTFIVLARVRVVPRDGQYDKHDAHSYFELSLDSALKDTDARDGVESMLVFDSFEDMRLDIAEGVLPGSLDA